MRNLLFIFWICIAFSCVAGEKFDQPSSDDTDKIYAEMNGSCTRYTCPPGTTVVVTAKKDDSSIATSDDGHNYDLLNFKKIKFTVIKSDNDYSADARVQAPSGVIYSIQWIFLKKI